MIRKLASGEYRLYQKKNPKTGKRRTSGRSRRARPPRNTSARCSTSSAAADRIVLQPRPLEGYGIRLKLLSARTPRRTSRRGQ